MIFQRPKLNYVLIRRVSLIDFEPINYRLARKIKPSTQGYKLARKLQPSSKACTGSCAFSYICRQQGYNASTG
jgi:triacylglycerol esterase/lipase EstA (alpha/beta hydrolase family)